MKNRTITIIGIIAAILMTFSGAELAIARGGGGGSGSLNGKGFNTNTGAGMSQMGIRNQYQYNHKNQYQYRQEHGISSVRSANGKLQGNQTQPGIRTQLRDPSSHEIKISE